MRDVSANQSDTVEKYFFHRISPKRLALLRILVGLHALSQALLISPHLLSFYGKYGHIQWILTDVITEEGLPRMSWIAHRLAPYGISADGTVYLTFTLYVVALIALTIGWNTRMAAVATWLLHLLFTKTSLLTSYGVETFTHVIMFLFIVFPVGAAWSIDAWSKGRTGEPSLLAGVSFRYLQLYLPLTYFTSGVAKGLGRQWWNGDAIWITMSQADFRTFDLLWLADYPLIPMMIGWSTIVLEAGYPLFISSRRTRAFVVLGICGMHLSIAALMQLWSFSALMIFLNVSIFGGEVVNDLRAPLGRLYAWTRSLVPAPPNEAVPNPQ